MDWQEYIRLAERTANRGPEDTNTRRLVMCALGLIGEAGEICDSLKKTVFHSHEFNRDAFIKELGDELWYVAITASTLSMNLQREWDLAHTVDDAQVADPADLVDAALTLGARAGDACRMVLRLKHNPEIVALDQTTLNTMTSWFSPALILISRLAKMVGSSLDDVAETNIGKLRARYPEGFEPDRSINRAV